jgi:hypothetical protein
MQRIALKLCNYSFTIPLNPIIKIEAFNESRCQRFCSVLPFCCFVKVCCVVNALCDFFQSSANYWIPPF